MFEDLKRINTYAKMRGVTYQCVKKWKNQKKIDIVDIDGVSFVKLKDYEKV